MDVNRALTIRMDGARRSCTWEAVAHHGGQGWGAPRPANHGGCPAARRPWRRRGVPCRWEARQQPPSDLPAAAGCQCDRTRTRTRQLAHRHVERCLAAWGRRLRPIDCLRAESEGHPVHECSGALQHVHAACARCTPKLTSALYHERFMHHGRNSSAMLHTRAFVQQWPYSNVTTRAEFLLASSSH